MPGGALFSTVLKTTPAKPPARACMSGTQMDIADIFMGKKESYDDTILIMVTA
jgi:hypothetical protein